MDRKINSMSLEIDHLFQVVASEEEAYRLATATGFRIFPKRVHEGQGTSAIFLMFEQNYFEYIWVSNEVESRQNEVQFYLRNEAVKNGGSPFGIALRGAIPDELETQFTEHIPKYGVGRFTLFFYNQSLKNYNAPELFYMNNPARTSLSNWYPKNLYADQQDKSNFEAPLKVFNQVTIYGKELPCIQILNVNFVQSDNNAMVINEGTKGKFTDFVFY